MKIGLKNITYRYFTNTEGTMVFRTNTMASDEDVPEGKLEITKEQYEASITQYAAEGVEASKTAYSESQAGYKAALMNAGLPEAAVDLILQRG